ncbi:flagellar basal body P-ring biosynthesis protein FlgA [compost metagenome]
MLLLVARHTLERDQTLGADDVHTRRQSASKHRQGFYGRVADIEGLSAKRRIRTGQVLTPQLLGAPLLVRRGQRVTIVATHDGIEASTLGEALSNGSAGDVIRVRNQSSEKVIETQVTGEGVVNSTFRQGSAE